MARKGGSRTTLERRSRWIFGLLIVLTATACLAWPWWQLGRLARSGEPDCAQGIVQTYVLNLHALQFATKKEEQEQLARLAATAEGSPHLVRLAAPGPAQPQIVPGGLEPFEAEAIEAFLKHPDESRQWKAEGNRFLYVQAVRAESNCLSCHSGYGANDPIAAVSLALDISERNRRLAVSRLVLGTTAAGGVGLGLVVFYALFRHMVVRPVQHLRDVADRVSAGDLQVRCEIDTRNELEALADALNHMLDRLAQAQAELREADASRDAKLEELTQANVALFEMNQMKSKFLTTMSHELRTPLNSILGFAQVLGQSEAVAGDAKLIRYVQNIQTSGRMLLELINDLLDLAKIESGRIQVRCEKVSPQDIAESVCNMVRPLAAEKPLKLVCDVDPKTPVMNTDGVKVQQILYNLMSNAIKFTEEGEVRLAARPVENRRVAFAVSDTGPGIAREQQLRIFDQFTQLDSSHTRRHRGTGLGLSIVKELTGLLGGEVTVQSELGQGTSFTVLLPMDSSEAAKGKPSADDYRAKEESQDGEA